MRLKMDDLIKFHIKYVNSYYYMKTLKFKVLSMNFSSH